MRRADHRDKLITPSRSPRHPDLTRPCCVVVCRSRARAHERLTTTHSRAEVAEHDPFRHHRAYHERAPADNWLNKLLYVDLKTFLPCLNLVYTDKMSMAASTEVRVPLLDDEMVGLAASLPRDLSSCGSRFRIEGRAGLDDVGDRPIVMPGATMQSWASLPDQ